MNWRQKLTDILWDQHIEQGDIIDLDMAVEELRRQCPGEFTIHWHNKHSNLEWYQNINELDVDITFPNDSIKTEWLLRWA